MILVDGGSIHNFILAQVAHFITLPTIAINPLQVMASDDDTLLGHRVCPHTPLAIQDH